MVTKAKAKTEKKAKAKTVDVSNLVSVGVYERKYKTGSTGFSGRVIDIKTKSQYMVTAVKLA